MGNIDFDLFKLISEEYGEGVSIENYKGVVSLVACNQKDDEVWKQWAFPQKRVNGENVPGNKALPIKIKIGTDKKTSIETLQFFIDKLNGATSIKEVKKPAPIQQAPPETDDIPF